MIVALSSDTDIAVENIGGKGAGLVRLLTAGLPVPEAWCIPADISLHAGSRASCLEEGLAHWWEGVDALFPGAPWAVRSSAVAEDLADASFAGVYETVLGVDSLDGLRDAVRTCWASFDDTRAQTYRDNLAKTNAVGIALILQRMISPDAAGVLLTANPLRPFAPEIVIDAAWGLGETVVSGRTDPDNFVLDRAGGTLRSRTLGAKATEAVWDHGVHVRDVESARRDEFCLTTPQLHDLHDLSKVATERIGPRRDLEWAIADGRLFVLQDRPITNLPSDDPVDVWSRRFGDEYLSDCTLPLPEDLMVPWIIEMSMKEMAGLQGRRDMAGMAPVRLHHGYAYFSGAYFVEGLRMLPSSMRSNGADQWFPPLVLDRVRAATWDPRLLAGFALAPWRDRRRSGLKNNLVALERHCAAIEATIVPKLDQDYGALSDGQWRRQYDEVNALGEEHFRIVRWGMTIYNSFLHALLQRLLETWCDDTSGELYQHVISGLDDTKTAMINTEITGLARTALDDAELTTMVRGGATYQHVRERTPVSQFWRSYDEFLARHGHRSDSRDIGRPRWREQPHLILELVRAQLRATDTARPQSNSSRQRRHTAETDALARLGNSPLGRVRRPILIRLMTLVQDYTRYRENQRYHLDYLLTHLRSLVLEQANRLVRQGILTEPDDVFLLRGEEFFAVIAGGAAPAELARHLDVRRAEFARNAARLPATYLFDNIETEVDTESSDEHPDLPEGAIGGTAFCHGLATGPARVVHTLADLGKVEAGDILVAPNIDPGWTSVFPLLSGLVVETGGKLSHGAILSREYGIPAVGGITGATKTIVDRAQLTVDGHTGSISL
ncbi:PEP/pyruvate-binding domain-containing protein [Mycolicibacterium fluoranthenivorans]|uniref:Pyruvate, water dikinase n=1 Tax=Mycolicibacterium fluoranthenivorans TaxID=258505 RepID=A0A1G4WKY7_9MYCO|nr:PEP/pyruvate-binding domain-containing protein [Mycolicibacterium fluoranthenivorans]SCX24416.1 pyruvate, water dikinase [Mycolicibacterium fluoranthenivorans]